MLKKFMCSETAHKLFQHKLFGPRPKHPIWGPKKKFMSLISWERTQKRKDPPKLFGGIFGVKKGVPNGPFLARTCLVHCFFPALIFPSLIYENTQKSRISRRLFGVSRPNCLCSWASRARTNFSTPPQLHGRPPCHRTISGSKS